MIKEFKMEDLDDKLLLSLYTKYPNTIDLDSNIFVEELIFNKGTSQICTLGIRLDFRIFLEAFGESCSNPEIVPNIETYLIRESRKIRFPLPKFDLKKVVLLNISEPKNILKAEPFEQKYFDAYWHIFETTIGMEECK